MNNPTSIPELEGLFLLAESVLGLRQALDPAKISNPAWRGGLENLGPWHQEQAPGLGLVFRPAAPVSGPPVFLCGPCSSGLDVAWRLDSALPAWTSVLAVSQWAGRGQLRREWISPVGNLYVAFKWPLEPAVGDGPVSLAAGLLTALALEVCLGLPKGAIQVKWPNDLLWRGRKVGGLLLEERDGLLWVGLGLNLASAPPDRLLRQEGACPAGCLDGPGRLDAPSGSAVLPVWLGLVQEMKSVYSHMAYPKADFWLRVMAGLDSRLAFMGQTVDFFDDAPVRGRLVGLDQWGALRLRLADGREKVFVSGSIRGPA